MKGALLMIHRSTKRNYQNTLVCAIAIRKTDGLAMLWVGCHIRACSASKMRSRELIGRILVSRRASHLADRPA